MMIVATTTWNSIGLIGTFLSHYRKLGFDQILAMDFDSTDGTLEVLQSSEWRDFVQLLPFPGIAGIDSSNIFLSAAKERFERDSWCLFCDPDELLVTPSMTIRERALRDLLQCAELISIPRFNVTAPRSIACSDQSRLSAVGGLTLRIQKRSDRDAAVDINKETLDPPWIFTAIPGKVLVKLEPAIAIGDGDHTATLSNSKIMTATPGMYLLHYPFRSYAEFRDKIRIAEITYRSSPNLPPLYGWQQRRWISISRSGRLHEEYLQQFINDEHLEGLLKDGTLFVDDSVVRFHHDAAIRAFAEG